MSAPLCPNGHGPMILVENPSTLQASQGEWWQCAPGQLGDTCRSFVLLPSDEALRSGTVASPKPSEPEQDTTLPLPQPTMPGLVLGIIARDGDKATIQCTRCYETHTDTLLFAVQWAPFSHEGERLCPLPWFEDPVVSHLQRFLMRAGWTRRSGHVGLDEIWTSPGGDVQPSEAVLVPLDPTKGDYQLLTDRAYETLQRHIRPSDFERLGAQLYLEQQRSRCDEAAHALLRRQVLDFTGEAS